VTQRGARAGRQQQRPPAVPVHGQRERRARHDYEQAEQHGASVRRQPRTGQRGRRVRLQHAGAARHLQHGQRDDDDQRRPVPVQQVRQFALTAVADVPVFGKTKTKTDHLEITRRYLRRPVCVYVIGGGGRESNT